MNEEEIENIKRRLTKIETHLGLQEKEVEVGEVDWTPFKSGKGYWAYVSDRDGIIYPEILNLVLRLKTKPNKTETVGNFNYRLSGDNDKFLQRFPADR